MSTNPFSTSRPALRPINPEPSPAPSTSRPEALMDDRAKRQRLAAVMQTPGAPAALAGGVFSTPMPSALHERPPLVAPPSVQQTGDILDYLKGRGGKIKELEEDVTRLRASNEALQSELRTKSDQLTRVQAELKAMQMHGNLRTPGAPVAGPPGAASPGPSSHELAEKDRLLNLELAKNLQLEEQLAAARARLSMAEERAAAAESSARTTAADQAKALKDKDLEVERMKAQLQNALHEAEERVKEADRNAKLEARKREADAEVHKAIQRQLREVNAELAAKTEAMKQLQSQTNQAQRMASLSSPPASVDGLQQRVRALEEALQQRDAELTALRAQQLAWQQRRLTDGGASAAAAGAENAASVAAAEALAHVAELQARMSALQNQVEAWERVSSTVPGLAVGSPVSPEGVAAAIGVLARDVSELKRALADKDGMMLELRAVSDACDQRRQVLQEQLQQQAAKLSKALLAESILERKLAMVAEERDHLRRSLAAPVSPGAENPASGSGRFLMDSMQARVAEAEGHARVLRAQLETAQVAAATAEAGAAAAKEAEEAANAKAEAAHARCERLEKEADSLARDVATLQEKLGRGEVNRSSVRVLHLKMNPEAEYNRQMKDADIAALKAENDALKSALSDLEKRQQAAAGAGGAAAGAEGPAAGAAGTGDAASAQAFALRDAEIAVLRHRTGEQEKAMTRLKEVTRERIAAFREAAYCLFGYRVDMTAEATAARDAASAPTTFSLRPQHADDPNALLVFRYTKERGMELVPTPFTEQRLAREVETFVRKFNCIPALTANLTMENFQKQTQC